MNVYWWMEVGVMSEAAVRVAAFSASPVRRARVTAAEQVRVRKQQPISSIEELACDVWESDKELEEFLEDLYASRHLNVA